MSKILSRERTIGIIGSGPSGVMTAITASSNKNNKIVLFDKRDILMTILPTGGKRCNLGYQEFDIKSLAKYYPRGEKFLLSLFSRFSTKDTIEFFNKINVKTYAQDDRRIFPKTNSSKDVREKLIIELKKNKNIEYKKEKIIDLKLIKDKDNKTKSKFILTTDRKNEYEFDNIVLAAGGKNNLYDNISFLGHKIIPLKPALCSLRIKEENFYKLSGLTLRNIRAKAEKNLITGDLLFSHNKLTGPLIYKISSIFAYKEFPYSIYLNFTEYNIEELKNKILNSKLNNVNKNIINIIAEYIPRSLGFVLLEYLNIDSNLKLNEISKKNINLICEKIVNFEVNVTDSVKGDEVVTAGGISLDEVNNKTLESKIIEGLYFVGENLDIDGFTGGFNLQNCWTSGYIVGKALNS